MRKSESTIRRLASASAVYGIAGIAQRGLSFLLLPVYTRLIDPREYGVLELLTSLGALLYGCLALGLPSAINKCYHRDCKSEHDRSSLLFTSVLIDLPILLLGSGLTWLAAKRIGWLLTGSLDTAGLVRLTLATGVCSTIFGMVLASLRARERAGAFGLVNLTQFLLAFVLNLVLVVKLGLGITGILLGNLISLITVLPFAILAAGTRNGTRWNPSLVRPLLRFGLALVPVMVAGWVIDLSDRYLLRLLSDLEEVAVYGVGYKFGMILQIVIVTPFQLAWPAVSFSVATQEGHKDSFARVATYLFVTSTYAVVALSLLSRVAVPILVGEGYREAYQVVPLVALAYAFNGMHFCLSPGVHLAGKTGYFPAVSIMAAGLNVALNFLLIPVWGMMGAAAATVVAFFFMALATWMLGQRYYPVKYEYGRLTKAAIVGLLVFFGAGLVSPDSHLASWIWHLFLGLLAFPAILLASRFLDTREKQLLGAFISRISNRK